MRVVRRSFGSVGSSDEVAEATARGLARVLHDSRVPDDSSLLREAMGSTPAFFPSFDQPDGNAWV